MLRRFVVRKLIVNVLAAVAVLALAGGALAGTSAFSQLAGDPAPAPESAETDARAQAHDLETVVLDEETSTAETSFGQVRSAEVRRFGECMSAAASAEDREACQEFKPGPATETEGHPGKGGDGSDDDGDADPVDDGDDGDEGESFGQVRSAEVRRFGECMSAAASAADREACQEFKPGPATETEGHPGKGDDETEVLGDESDADEGGDDARPPEGVGKPDDAGPPSWAKGGGNGGKGNGDR